jgi:hypothetical protein
LQGKNKTQQITQDKKLNMAITKDDSIFPNIHLPGGISSKATEYKKMAKEGKEWRSPVFKLGSASSTSNIPPATQVTRKDHPVTEGGVGGPQNVGNTGPTANQLRDPHAQTAGTTRGPAINGSAVNGSGVKGSGVNGSAGFANQLDSAFDGKPTNGVTKTNAKTSLDAANLADTDNYYNA